MKRAFYSGLFMLLCASAATAQEMKAAPLRTDHPLVGAWKIELPELSCYEMLNLRANGTKRTMSGKEISESIFQMSAYPSRRGFYKWVDKIIKNNGKPDCTGDITPIGDIAVSYIYLHPDGTRFLLCAAENLNECIGPYVRQEII